MHFPQIREGDILLYYRVEPDYWVSERAIQAGEVIEDGLKDREYYHVAVAIDSRTKIEAIGGARVGVKNLVQDGSFDVFRPPCRQEDVRRGLFAVRQDIGQQYDMWLNIDDGLRIISGGRLHLPDAFIRKRESNAKNCVSLLHVYLKAARSPIQIRINDSPEDVYLAVLEYEVE